VKGDASREISGAFISGANQESFLVVTLVAMAKGGERYLP
jgi:hypothetical protein